MKTRRKFIHTLGGASLGVAALGIYGCSTGSRKEDEAESSTEAESNIITNGEMFFNISLAEWSLHKTIRSGEMTNLDFPAIAKNKFGIDAVEYVNQFFMDQARNQSYLQDLKSRCDDNGVTSVLIMVDDEGDLGNTNETGRNKVVDNHRKWLEAAKYLGCHSIRVNAAGTGSMEDVASAAVDGLGKLSEFGRTMDINVIVENHGGYSSDGQWLSGIIKEVNSGNCGTLPDFGNFCIEDDPDGGPCKNEYDRYKGVRELMPYARGVSAKSNVFDSNGNEVNTDYKVMLQIVKDAGYKGFIGIEYEGEEPEESGIMKTKALLEKVGPTIS